MKRMVILFVLMAASCVIGDTGFKVHRASDFPQGGGTVSVFGVFKGGRMNQEYWDQIGPEVRRALGWKECAAGWDGMQLEAPDLYAKIDQETKDDGITGELVSEIAPHATGSMILVVEVFGQAAAERPARPGAQQQPVSQQQRGFGGRGGRRGFGGGGRQVRNEPADDRAFEVSLTLYSVRQHETVAKIEMRYTGASSEDALKQFADKLHTELPGMVCAGWQWKV